MTDREKLIEILTQSRREGAEELGVTPCDKAFCDKNKEDCNGKFADRLIANGVTVQKRGEWISAYEHALKIGVTDKEMLENCEQDKWWYFCKDCDQQVKGHHNYCPNCGADMRKEKEK